MFGLKREDVTKIYKRLLHIKFIHYITSCYNRHQGWEWSNPDRCHKNINYFKLQTQENYPLDVEDADRKVILKEIINVYDAIICERQPAK
jgi:hypothetical protein